MLRLGIALSITSLKAPPPPSNPSPDTATVFKFSNGNEIKFSNGNTIKVSPQPS